ncbi:hypothetical protein V5G24_23165 [Xanthobacter sp. VTT E-85241]|uniref:hypothetical protein n=1 Tax=Roseixanthobacter finlandensis TaxID=3119922 RepID=UPI0037282AAA
MTAHCCGWRALSVIQPWTWVLAHGFKPVENRNWRPGNPGLRFRGDVLLHAGQKFDSDGYDWIAATFPHIPLPHPDAFERGGIVGQARIVDVVREMESPWFFGPIGLVFADAKPLPFQPCKGALGFFNPAWGPPSAAPAAPAQETLL